MAAPELRIAVRFYSPEISFSGKFYIHTEKAGNIAGFSASVQFFKMQATIYNFLE